MDPRLVEAARGGDVIALHRILEEDPQILEKASLAFFAESPLHVAALAGKVDFVEEIIKLMPSLARQTNQQGLIPLHMASAAGHVETVRELLKANLDEVNQCLMKDDEGRTPLHYSAIQGRVEVIQELINHSPECLEEVTPKGETVLHLAVKANQFGAGEVLEEKIKRLPNFQTLLGAKDNKGKTVYELAATKKQFRVLDIGKEENDASKEENEASKESGRNAADRGKDQYGFQNIVLLVATIVITLTYQGLLNPPSTLFKHGNEIAWGCLTDRSAGKNSRHRLLDKLKHCPANLALLFLIINTAIFLQSIFLVVSTLRGRRVFLLRLLTVFLTFSYSTLLMAFSDYTAYFALPLGFLALIYLLLIVVKENWVIAQDWVIAIVCKLAKKEGERSN